MLTVSLSPSAEIKISMLFKNENVLPVGEVIVSLSWLKFISLILSARVSFCSNSPSEFVGYQASIIQTAD